MKMKIWLVLLVVACGFGALAQGDRRDKNNAVTFEELYDEPYSINKLFVGFQPLYGEVFATNVNAGFGIEASYYLRQKADFRLHYRRPYGSNFYDLNLDLAGKNGNNLNQPTAFSYLELGGTYHIKDFDESTKTKMVLYKNSYKGNKWAGRVPLKAEVPAKVRKIYGARLGAVVWQSTVDLDRVMESQGLTGNDFLNAENNPLPATYVDNLGQTQDVKVFSNLSAAGLYVGGSLSWFRNIAVSFDSYEEAVDDGLLTVYLDILISPSLTLDPIQYVDPVQGLSAEYSVDAIKTSPVGFRLGLDGKFNRMLSWAYGGEFGYRPSLKGQSFFAMFKISFPVFGTNLDYKVESFGK